MNTPALSIVIPCYNQGSFLLDALESVLPMTGVGHETIIVDDGSDDPATVEILAGLDAAGWRILRQSNQGLAAARNAGCEAAVGEFLLPLDADNRINPVSVGAAVESIRKSPQVGVAYGDCELFGEESGRRDVPEFDLHRLYLGNYIDACAVVRKQAWEGAGGYDAGARCFEDWDLWLSIGARGWEFLRLPEVLFYYRVRAGSMLSRGNQPGHYHAVVRYMATKHPYYLERAALVIADLSRIRLLYEQSRRDLERYVRELESSRVLAEIYADSLKAEMTELQQRNACATAYAHSLEAEMTELQRRNADATAYARSLEKSRQELEVYTRSLEVSRQGACKVA